MNESRTLAAFVSDLKYDDLPREVVAKAKVLIIDQLGIMMAVSTMPWSQVIYRYVREWGDCKQESTIVHYGDKTKTENAAFANSSFGHGFEIDDMFTPAQSHPGCVVVPSALALGEREGISGKQLILAVVAGYEVMGRINKAISPSCGLRGFHAPTSVSGPFGAASAAGKILGFAPELMLNALAIAGSHSCGVKEYDHSGGSVKRMHAGMAAHGGLRAAFTAQMGITGPSTILEGPHGFCHAFADEYHLNEVTDGLGKEFRVVMGTTIKAYCACGAMHAAIDAVHKLVVEHDVRAKDVAQLTMGTDRGSIDHVGVIREPKDITGAQFSAPFSLAMTMIKGSNSFSDYTQENIDNAEIMTLARKVKLEVDKEVNAEWPGKRAARVTLKLNNGRVLSEKVDYCKGSPQNPLTKTEFDAKFRGLVSVVADKKTADKIMQTTYSLEQLGDVRTLVSLLSQKDQPAIY